MPSADKFREIANTLIKQSLVDGKLDLVLLREKTNEAAEGRNENIKFTAYNGQNPSADVALWLKDNLALATREVLGVIPQKEWRDDRGFFAKRFGDDLFKPDHGLVITDKPKQAYDHDRDSKKSLKELGYEFELPEKEKSRRKETLAVLVGNVKTMADVVTQPSSLGGEEITQQEKGKLDVVMQTLIDKQEALGVALGPVGRRDLDAALDKIQGAGVKLNDNVLGEELQALRKLVPDDKTVAKQR